MNGRAVFHLISYTLFFMALFLGVSCGVSVHYQDPQSAQTALGFSALITLVGALSIWTITRGKIDLSRRDGFAIVAFGWIAATLFGCLPYLISGVIAHPADAIFETMSGFTTTGASVLTDLESIPRGILFWRCLTQWIGGMGVLVLCVAILPFLGVGGMQIYRAEMPGPSKDRLTPRIARTAEYLWGVYLGLTIAQTLLLHAGGLSWFDSLCHTFATLSTGGFSTLTASVGGFQSLYVESVIILFMILASINFALHFRVLRGHPTAYFRDPECRMFLTIWILACAFLAFNTWGSVYPTLGEAVRGGVFQCTSIISTTGFATADFDQWPNASRILLVILMCTGACAGSTSGSMKMIRVLVLLKTALREIRTYMRPQAVIQVKLGNKPVDGNTISNITVFFAIFFLTIGFGTFIMTFYTPDLVTAATCVIATLGNIGPGLALVGPSETFAFIAPSGKLLLTLFMLLGRLELFTVLVLFMPVYWRK